MNNNYFYKRLFPLGTAQTLGVFNDNAFKSVVIFIALGLSKDYSINSFFIAVMTVIFVAPFLIFTVPSGYLADKYPKWNVMAWSKFSEIIVMLLGAIFFYFIPIFGVYPVVIILFLMATQSSVFSPSYNSILPEIFSEDEISKANGILGMFNFLAVIIGFAFGIVIKSLVGDHYYICGIIFSIISVVGFLSVLKVKKTPAGNRSRKWNSHIFREFKKIIKLIVSQKVVFISMLGEAYFYAIGSAIQTVVILFGKFTLKLTRDLEIGLLQLVMAIGIAIGCYLGGRLSKNKLEIGLVPLGAMGMIIFLVLINFYKGPSVSLPFGHSGFIIYPQVLFNLVMTGVFAGIYVIPLRVCQQERTGTKERGRILAFANFCTFASILLSGVIIYILTGKDEVQTGTTVSKISIILNKIMLNCSPSGVLIIIVGVTLGVTIIAMIIHFEYLYRAIAVLLTRTVYRLSSIGEKNIPKKGAAILVSNHVSLLDTFLISSCTSRNIHFVIHEDYYKHPLLRKFYKYCKFIQYPAESKNLYSFYEQIKNILRDGEIVCIFPEGRLTRNGIIGKFKINIHMLKNKNAPVIPVHLGKMWGSIFSYYYGNIKIRFPGHILHPVKVSFGKSAKNISSFKIRQRIIELSADAEFSPGKNEKVLHVAFAKIAKHHPFQKSFIDYDGNELRRFSLLLRSILLSRKIRKIDHKNKYIGVFLPNCTTAAATILGVMIADKIPVILNYSVTDDIFDLSMKKADLDTIITSKQFIDKVNIKRKKEMVFLEDVAKTVNSGSKLFYFSVIAILPYKLLMRIVSPKSHIDPLGAAVVLFSSGSSGIPKGVVLSHHNLTSNVNSFAKVVKCEKGDKITGNLPFFHSFGINVCFWIPLMTKISVVYIKNPLDAESVVKAIKRYKLTLLMSAPTFLQSYLRKSSVPSDFKSLRLVVLGAEKMRLNLAKRFKEYTEIELVEGFGCTELSPVVTINVPDSVVHLGKKSGKQGSVGCSMPGICTKIVDADTFEDLGPNHKGLLLVKGPNVMKGYLGEPEETRKAIVDGWYNTGDIAIMNKAGFITITGRLSRFSKIGGEMISHEFIECSINEILGEENRVIAVTGIPDTLKGEKIVVLYEKLSISPKKIIKVLRDKGIANIWIPKAENFVKIDKIPLLGTGKLDISKLNKIALSLSNF
jgi:acyl-[acyl-carrier-protein]-phospholipid O-acyltransferase / long-chain-fatty-acid--[acyl-carrier-protein] ligase